MFGRDEWVRLLGACVRHPRPVVSLWNAVAAAPVSIRTRTDLFALSDLDLGPRGLVGVRAGPRAGSRAAE